MSSRDSSINGPDYGRCSVICAIILCACARVEYVRASLCVSYLFEGACSVDRPYGVNVWLVI